MAMIHDADGYLSHSLLHNRLTASAPSNILKTKSSYMIPNGTG